MRDALASITLHVQYLGHNSAQKVCIAFVFFWIADQNIEVSVVRRVVVASALPDYSSDVLLRYWTDRDSITSKCNNNSIIVHTNYTL